MRTKPVLTARQIASNYHGTLKLGEPVIVPCDYTIDGIAFTGKFKLIESAITEPMVICPTCKCNSRFLYPAIGVDGERCPGLHCGDCNRDVQNAEPKRLGYRKSVKKGKAA